MNEKVVSGRVKRDRIGAVEAHVAVESESVSEAKQ